MHRNKVASINYCIWAHTTSPFKTTCRIAFFNTHPCWKACTKLGKCWWKLALQGERSHSGVPGSGVYLPCIHHTFSSNRSYMHQRWGMMYSLPCLLAHRLYISKIKRKELKCTPSTEFVISFSFILSEFSIWFANIVT